MVLIMAMVFLVVISLVASIAIRSAMSDEQVGQALRSNDAAFQAAETALRYCENQILVNSKVVVGTRSIDPLPYPTDGSASGIQWNNRANWAPDAGMALEIAAANSADEAAKAMPVLPRCMVEMLRLPQGQGARREAFLITAVGYSADYRTNAGRPDSGGEVWLQSTLIR